MCSGWNCSRISTCWIPSRWVIASPSFTIFVGLRGGRRDDKDHNDALKQIVHRVDVSCFLGESDLSVIFYIQRGVFCSCGDVIRSMRECARIYVNVGDVYHSAAEENTTNLIVAAVGPSWRAVQHPFSRNNKTSSLCADYSKTSGDCE